jgi:inner membrane protein
MKNPIFLFLFWLRTNGLLLGCLLLCIARANTSHPLQALALGAVLIMLGSFPALVALWAGTSLIALLRGNWPYRMYALLLLQTTICLVYTLFCLPLLFGYSSELWYAAAVLLACSYASSLYHLRSWNRFFLPGPAPDYCFLFQQLFFTPFVNSSNMKTYVTLPGTQPAGNKIFFKALLTAVLILLLLVPGRFVNSLIEERQNRQEEIVKEVCSKWANAQTLSGPYLLIPYTTLPDSGKNPVTKYLTVLPENLVVNGNLIPEERTRSIYRVLLYRSKLAMQGNFHIHIPPGIPVQQFQWNNASICFGLSDIRGIEEKPGMQFNNQTVELAPGLPAQQLDSTGLAAPVALSNAEVDRPVSFAMNLAIKGSGQLHFLPLGSNSRFTLHSSWPNPSFDGNTLPAIRDVSAKGFTASWTFNPTSLPFTAVPVVSSIRKQELFFGISMLQPSDQYAKTMRCAKYALLIISLSFALFFVIELLQKNPLHPVQYVLAGLALLVFYTLLLSISEFLMFDAAYTIAAAATVLLITLYAWWHFKKTGIALLFLVSLAVLYGFIFVLIRLEDTALLVGSISLFIILATLMYASRRIKWYGEKAVAPNGSLPVQPE